MPPNKDAPGCLGSSPGLICLPPISEDLQLLWTQAAQTSDLDGNQHLLQTFSYFPYPSLSDLTLLCLHHGLHMEKVKAWFMAQRLRCGISWSAEEIEETRARLIYHQDQLHFCCLLAGNSGDSWHQSYKSQEYHQPPPASMHFSKYPENQPSAVTSFNHCSTVQTTELGRVAQETWDLKGNLLSRHSKAQENCDSAGTSLHFPPNTKQTFPTTTTSLDYKFQNSHAMTKDPTKSSPPPTQTVTPVVNGGHHPVILSAGSSIKPSPSFSMATARVVEPNGLQSYQNPDQQVSSRALSGCLQDTLRRPRRKTKEQLDILKSFFLRQQWANREDYCHLEQTTGLPRAEIIQWFGDTRYALKHGQLKWFRDNVGLSPEPAPSLPHPPHSSHPDTSPLERYWATHLQLQESDLPTLCLDSGMEAEQVVKWFNSHSSAPCEVEVCLGEEDEVDEEEAAAMIKEDEDYEEEEEDDDDDEEDDI